MKTKSITKKRVSPAKSDCPRADVPVRGNSPAWYEQENLPYKGENFNALTSLSPQPGVMFEDGVCTNAAVLHFTVIHPPVDLFDSFFKKAADFYAEIRERNSGAANYRPIHVAAYMYNVGVLHALAHVAARCIKAVRSVMPSSADSPYILSALAGCPNYSDVASRLAVLSNRYTLLAKDIENLPLPHVTAFDRSRFLYSSFFADSTSPKPALISFLPTIVLTLGVSESNELTTTEIKFPGVSQTGKSYLDQALSAMDTILSDITGNYLYTILRGDIRNAFGSSAYWEGLTSLISQPLNLLPEDAEVMSQLENLSMIPRDSDGGYEAHYEYNEDDKQYVLRMPIDGINDSPSLSRVWCDNNMVNYHGRSPTDGELIAITRMMYIGRKENNATRTDAIVTASSGNTVYFSYLITNVSATDYSWVMLSSQLMAAQTSTIQSTASQGFIDCSFAASNISHFPMLIWDESPRGYMWDVDNYAIMSNVNLMNMTVIANRSLWDVHLPRGPSGRLEKRA